LRVNKADRPRALDLYQKALAIKQRLISEQPNNTDYQRLAAYDQFNISHLMAELDDPNGALTLGREALASFQQLAAADPSSPLYQEDIIEVRGDIGETLVKLGKFDEAFHEIQGSLSMAEKMPGAQDPQQPVGFIVLRDQFRMGQAYTHLALSQVGEKKANQCRQAESWFKRCQPAFQALQDHGSFKEEAAAYIRDIQRLQSSCSSTAVP
jgi:tetratricopeptide (TPR) repeat protein